MIQGSVPAAAIMNRPEVASQAGTKRGRLALAAGNVTEEVKGSQLRLMRNLYDGEHTRKHGCAASERFDSAIKGFLTVAYISPAMFLVGIQGAQMPS